MKLFLRWVLIITVTGLVLFGMYRFRMKRTVLDGEVNAMQAKFNSIQEDNAKLSATLKYFELPENLVKEVKSQFNFRSEDEKLIIVIPKTSSTLQDSLRD